MRTRNVNGEKIPFTPEQEASRDAEEAAEQAKPKPKKPVDIENLVDLLVDNNIITSSEAATLRT